MPSLPCDVFPRFYSAAAEARGGVHVGARTVLVSLGPLLVTMALLSIPLGGLGGSTPAEIRVGWLIAFELAYTVIEFAFVAHWFRMLQPRVAGRGAWAAMFVLAEGLVALCTYEAATRGALQGAALWRIVSTFCVTCAILAGHAATVMCGRWRGAATQQQEHLAGPPLLSPEGVGSGVSGEKEEEVVVGSVLAPRYQRWLASLLIIAMLTSLYMFCQVFTDYFAAHGTPGNAVLLYAVFLSVISAASFVFSRLGRAIDRSPVYSSPSSSSRYSTEFALAIVCQCFYVIFYRNLFTSVDSYTTFFEVPPARARSRSTPPPPPSRALVCTKH
jgi:hypothetical protein